VSLVDSLWTALWKEAGVTPVTNDADVQVATGDEIRQAVEQTLTDAGVTLIELERQAATGEFSSDRVRRAWFTVSPVVRRS
jgi:hypothetical protein